jgi:hypothetical protein
MPLLRSRRVLAALTAAALPLAACGSSSQSNSGGTGTGAADPANYNQALAFAQCMRSHGVPSFPDPKSNGSGGMLIQSTSGHTEVNGVSVNGPAFQSAMQACRTKLPGGGKPRPLSAARRQQMLQFSQCMRAHGITNFPDPTFGSGGGVQLRIDKPTGIDPRSPAFQTAQKACGAPFGKVTAAAP